MSFVHYRTYGFNCEETSSVKQNYIDLLHKILNYTQTGLGNDAALAGGGTICAGPVGPGTLSEDVRDARGLLTWYLTEQAALQKIQPHQSLRSALINSRNRPGAKAVRYNVAPGSPSYSCTTTNDESAVAQQPTSPTDPVARKSPPTVGKPAGPKTRHKSPKETEVIVISDNDEAVAENETPSKTAHWSEVDKRVWHITVESVQKATVPSACSGLRIVSYAILHARPFLLATQHGDLLRTLTRH
jgi:hypothetical protein